MKLPVQFLLVLLLTIPWCAHSQNINGSFSDVVVEIPHFSELKQLPVLQSTLSDYAPNVTLKYFCKSSSWLLFRIYNGPVQSASELAEILKQAGFEFYMKEDAGLNDLAKACREELLNL